MPTPIQEYQASLRLFLSIIEVNMSPKQMRPAGDWRYRVHGSAVFYVAGAVCAVLGGVRGTLQKVRKGLCTLRESGAWSYIKENTTTCSRRAA